MPSPGGKSVGHLRPPATGGFVMEMVRAGHPARQLQALPRCACQSPVCPQEHGPTWSVAGDAGLIGLAVGVRRVVVLPVPRLRRRFSLAWPGRLRHS